MDFHRMVREFREEVETMKARDVRDLIPERKLEKLRYYEVIANIKVDSDFGGNVEDKLTRIRSIQGVTTVASEPTESGEMYRIKIRFHPELDSMRPTTYIRTVLAPDINSNRKVPGVKLHSIQPGSLKSI